jgi:hypothetical protein
MEEEDFTDFDQKFLERFKLFRPPFLDATICEESIQGQKRY